MAEENSSSGVDIYTHAFESFLAMEEILSRHRSWAEDVWEQRVGLANSLADSPHGPAEKKYHFGTPLYLAWLYWQTRNAAAAPHDIEIPAAEFLVYLAGNVSIEVNTLIPVARALMSSGHSVFVVLSLEGRVPEELAQRLAGIPMIQISDRNVLGPWLPYFWEDTAKSLFLIAKAFICLAGQKGTIWAFWKRGTFWLRHLVHSLAAERFWSNLLAQDQFKGVAVASEFACPAGALCKVAKRRSWRAHHLLHGLPSIQETRGIATDFYCYSSTGLTFFMEHGWPESAVHAIGHPRQGDLIEEIKRTRTLQPREGGVRLLFASQPPCPGWFEPEEYEKTVLAVLGTAAALGLGPDEFRVRLHPIEHKDKFAAIAASRGLVVPDPTFKRHPIVEDLAWANVVITVFSTMGMEAAYAECMFVWLSFGAFRYSVREELYNRGYGMLAKTQEELAAILADCRRPEKRARLTESFLESARRLKVLNPDAPKLIAEIMARES